MIFMSEGGFLQNIKKSLSCETLSVNKALPKSVRSKSLNDYDGSTVA